MNPLTYFISRTTHRLGQVPILVLMPHSRCNCRCVMCDIWRANSERKELSTELLASHSKAIEALQVKEVALSGGEALLHSNLWSFCEILKRMDIKISLLSTGLSLETHANEIVKNCDSVIVSIDGGPLIHDQIRNIPGAFEKMSRGVSALKKLRADFRITGRCVVQRLNFRDLSAIILAAHGMGLDQLSFLPADVSSNAFNRPVAWDETRKEDVALTDEEIRTFEEVLRRLLTEHKQEFENGFIAESKEKILQMAVYYRALQGKSKFPSKRCNAPWVSAVVEPNGDVLPCFFHPPYGNLNESALDMIINSPAAIQFRQRLDVKTNQTCKQCVCSLYRSPWTG